jgi:PIN domain nuclease of toxin-antitoxin system
MKLLVDSCVIVWWLLDPGLLSSRARAAISDPANEVIFSAASVWELGLKVSKGKLRIPEGFTAALLADGFSSLSVTVEHASHSQTLPPLHQDPFDRMLIAQAMSEGLILVTRDANIQRYALPVLVA